jgi:hypothetical protein
MRNLLVLMVAVISSSTLAQQPQPRPETTRKVTELTFGEGDTIEGDLSRPDVEYFARTGCKRGPNLIRVREEFKDKVMASVLEL